MIIWRGWGAIVLAIVFLSNLAANLITNTLAGKGYWEMHGWPLACALFAAGALIWATDSLLSRQPPRSSVDEKTGQRVSLPKNHEFFFLRIRWWALIVVFFGLAIVATGWSPKR